MPVTYDPVASAKADLKALSDWLVWYDQHPKGRAKLEPWERESVVERLRAVRSYLRKAAQAVALGQEPPKRSFPAVRAEVERIERHARQRWERRQERIQASERRAEPVGNDNSNGGLDGDLNVQESIFEGEEWIKYYNSSKEFAEAVRPGFLKVMQTRQEALLLRRAAGLCASEPPVLPTTSQGALVLVQATARYVAFLSKRKNQIPCAYTPHALLAAKWWLATMTKHQQRLAELEGKARPTTHGKRRAPSAAPLRWTHPRFRLGESKN